MKEFKDLVKEFSNEGILELYRESSVRIYHLNLNNPDNPNYDNAGNIEKTIEYNNKINILEEECLLRMKNRTEPSFSEFLPSDYEQTIDVLKNELEQYKEELSDIRNAERRDIRLLIDLYEENQRLRLALKNEGAL